MLHNSDDKNKKYIYVVFIMTNTYIGKIIRIVTRNEYNHVTIACDQDLKCMYSFARYHINSPIAGGFVEEHPGRYVIGNQDVNVKICRIPLDHVSYNRIQKEILYFRIHKERMIYNTVNALLSICQKRIPTKDAYTCLEFVTYILRIGNISAIKELERCLKKYEIYNGSLGEITGRDVNLEDEFFQMRRFRSVVMETMFHFGQIIDRIQRGNQLS